MNTVKSLSRYLEKIITSLEKEDKTLEKEVTRIAREINKNQTQTGEKKRCL